MVPCIAAVFCLQTMPVNAQADEKTGKNIALELNTVDDVGNGCRITFLASNGFDKDIKKLAYEFVLFNNEGRVERMTVFDFNEIQTGKFRVRQFQLDNIKCTELGRILVNGVSTCDGEGFDKAICSQSLRISNKTKIEFLN
jgi:hypothetical protein